MVTRTGKRPLLVRMHRFRTQMSIGIETERQDHSNGSLCLPVRSSQGRMCLHYMLVLAKEMYISNLAFVPAAELTHHLYRLFVGERLS